MWAYLIYSWVKARRVGVVRVQATVAGKHTEAQDPDEEYWSISGAFWNWVSDRWDIPWLDDRLNPTTYLALFKTPTGYQEFEVPRAIYVVLEDGQNGILVYFGQTFRNFGPDIPAH